MNRKETKKRTIIEKNIHMIIDKKKIRDLFSICHNRNKMELIYVNLTRTKQDKHHTQRMIHAADFVGETFEL